MLTSLLFLKALVLNIAFCPHTNHLLISNVSNVSINLETNKHEFAHYLNFLLCGWFAFFSWTFRIQYQHQDTPPTNFQSNISVQFWFLLEFLLIFTFLIKSKIKNVSNKCLQMLIKVDEYSVHLCLVLNLSVVFIVVISIYTMIYQ